MSRVHSRNSIYIDAQPVKNIGKDYEFVEGNNSLVRCKICQKVHCFLWEKSSNNNLIKF